MRQRPVLEFRTPQHPSSFSNNWGGASPLLARNLPKEALDQRYSRLNAVRDRDHIFPSATIETEVFSYPPLTTIEDEIFSFSATKSTTTDHAATWQRKGLLWRLTWRPRKQRATITTTTTIGSGSGSNWFPRWSSKKRWPNGWC